MPVRSLGRFLDHTFELGGFRDCVLHLGGERFVAGHGHRGRRAPERVLDHACIAIGTQEDPDRRIVPLRAELAVDHVHVGVELSGVGRRELADLELDHDVAVEREEVVAVDLDVNLAADEREPLAHLEQEVPYPGHQRRLELSL
ncbi:MAG TPA: hypothetical protein VG244_02560 [Acidimicrobiales bacterium]|nr:hypothetical protein [Acidimicrobiales bacterium]